MQDQRRLSARERTRPLNSLNSTPSTLVAACAVAVVVLSTLIMHNSSLAPVLSSHARTRYYASTLAASPRPRHVRFGSFNVRYAPRSLGPLEPLRSLWNHVGAAARPSAQSVPGLRGGDEAAADPEGETSWARRREKLVDQVLFHELDCVGFQEVLNHQLRDLEYLMGEEFGHVGVGRNDGKKAGEAVPIFYRKSRFALKSVQHRWLSPNPDRPGSKGWDAGQPRMVTIARLVDLESSARSGEEIVVANTHWDDRGYQARTESAKLILEWLDAEAKNATDAARDPLVVLLGDLNSPAEEAGYQILTASRYVNVDDGREGTKIPDRGAQAAFWDSRHEMATRETSLGGPGALSRPYGPHNTFTGFVRSDEPKIIDFILVLGNEAFSAPDRRHGHATAAAVAAAGDVSYLDADDPDEVLASIPRAGAAREGPGALGGDHVSESGGPRDDEGRDRRRREGQIAWKVSRYGVVPNFYGDVGGRQSRASRDDGLIVSDHRLVVVDFEQVVA